MAPSPVQSVARQFWRNGSALNGEIAAKLVG
jgi:hypothetical protein